jgi:hypothetical protein
MDISEMDEVKLLGVPGMAQVSAGRGCWVWFI